MATHSINFGGLRASLFGNANRIGVEFSVPFRWLSPTRAKAADRLERVAFRANIPEAAAVEDRISGITWYHTIDLGNGMITPGFFDHRPILERYRVPERLDGMRVLDIATFDGFWAFEFERRGAAEVIAIDIPSRQELDLPFGQCSKIIKEELGSPLGAGFQLAREVLRSDVRYEQCSVYDLTPERFGVFDFIHCGDLLIHLRDPALALWRIRAVTGGQALVSECFDPDLDRYDSGQLLKYEGGRQDNIWWRFTASALRAMIADAGFRRVSELSRFRYGPRGERETVWHAVFRAEP